LRVHETDPAYQPIFVADHVAHTIVMEIDLDLANRMCHAALEAATALGALVSAAVVDAGGHLVAFQRMDGAEIAGPVLAPDKAYTAVAHRIATHELAELTAPGGPLQGMYTANQGRFICFGGGLPLWSGGRVTGGVGVSGGSVEEDTRCAEAAALLWPDAGPR
jgi:uncharacterized protein GlcG (DUF336 family)